MIKGFFQKQHKAILKENSRMGYYNTIKVARKRGERRGKWVVI
jgi:hypothetical protein